MSYNSEWKFWNAERKVKGEERSNKDDDGMYNVVYIKLTDYSALPRLKYRYQELFIVLDDGIFGSMQHYWASRINLSFM